MWVSCQRLKRQLHEIHGQIMINVDLDFIMEGICSDVKSILFKEVYENSLIYGIYNPIFPYTGIGI